MNTTIIKGTAKVGLGKVVKKFASLTGNRKLYLKGFAEELIGKSQRSYGHIKEDSIDLKDMLVKRAKKLDIDKTVKNMNNMLMKRAKKMNLALPVSAVVAVGLYLVLK